MKEKEMTIQEAILNGEMCKDCPYYDTCYYDEDCIAMKFLKRTAIINEMLHSNNTRKSGDKA